MEAIQELTQEHNDIMIMLEILEQASDRFKAEGNGIVEHLEQILAFFLDFGDKCHHKKEEDLIYAAFQDAGMITDNHADGIVVISTITPMLKEHDRFQMYISEMTAALEKYRSGDSLAIDHFVESAKQYVALQKEHLQREEKVLYPLVSSHLPVEKLEELIRKFEQIKQDKKRNGKQNDFHEVLEHLKAIYLEPVGIRSN